jgi:hypothetical protein
MTLHRAAILEFCLLIICLTTAYPLVLGAQTTKITQLTSSTSIVAGSENPIPLTVTISYNAVPGYQLIVGILDANMSSQRIVPGVVVSSSDPCVNQPEPAALCAIALPAASGVEVINFQIGGIFGGRRGPGIWDLNVTSALLDTKGNLVPGSVSSALFQVNLTPLVLTIDVPPDVVATINGVQQTTGPASVEVAMGQNNITVPQFVQLNESSRLSFDHWSDGYPTPARNIVITNTTTLQAIYATQNLLTLVGLQGNATGTGWYDANSTATFATSQYQPIVGSLGTLGARLSFQGWYENGQLLTNSPTGTISMNEPHTLTAVWQMDYTIPIVSATIVIIGAVAVIFLILRRGKLTTTRSRKRSRRKRS